MKKAIYAGSFDPFTNGHLNVLKQSSKIFDNVYIVIAVNQNKKRRIDIKEMEKCIKQICKNNNLINVEVLSTTRLIAKIAKNFNAEYLIRGVRNGIDFEYEENIAKINEQINPKLKTIYFRAGNTDYISSSAVMEIFNLNGDISNWVPKEILKLLKKRGK